MSPKGRITKKEVKEDKLVTFTFRMTEFFQRHTNQVLVGAGVLVAAAVLVYFFVNSRSNQAKEAQTLLAQANLELKAGNIQQAVSILDVVIRRFAGTKSGKRASFLLGNAYFYSREYQLAKTKFEEYLRSGREPYLLASAQAGIAQCQLEMGDFLLAGENFAGAAQRSPEDFLKREYLFNAAWSFSKTNQQGKAREMYEELISRFPESPQAQKAKMDLAQMGQASS